MLGLGTLAPCLLGWREEQARSGPWTVLAPNSAPKWLKQTFDEADKNGDGSLSISEVLQLLHKLNVNLPRQRVKQMFRVSVERGGLCPPVGTPLPRLLQAADGKLGVAVQARAVGGHHRVTVASQGR